MIPAAFEYHAPRNLEEASQLLAQYGENGKLLAGGHSLVPMMKMRLAMPQHLIDLNRLPDLRYIREADGKIQIGALTTHFQIESSGLLKSKCPLLPETAREIGDVQVRNRGTVGGSLAHADPAADWPAAMLAAEAEIEARSAANSRWIPARDFFVDLLTTALGGDEVLTAVRIPVAAERSGSAYLKLRHPASGYAAVGVAVCLTLGDAGHIEQVAVGITGAGPKAYRATSVEEDLKGKSASGKTVEQAAARVTEGVELNSDLYATAEYRSHLTQVYTRRAIEVALERARAEPARLDGSV
jgi:aerobic carbon-monoxide dehydrogenase medium subunit